MFDLVAGADEVGLRVLALGTGALLGKSALSIGRFGTDADLCFELGDDSNQPNGGRLLVKAGRRRAVVADLR